MTKNALFLKKIASYMGKMSQRLKKSNNKIMY